MARRVKTLPSLSNVAAGLTASLELPLGAAYHTIYLEYSGVTLAQMKKIRIEVNGKVVQEFENGVQLDELNQYYNRGDAANGILPIHFTRTELKDVLQQRVFAIGTADISTLTLRFDIDAAAANPVVKAHAMQGNQSPIGYITKVKSFPRSFSTGGLQEIDNLPRPRSARIAAVHLISDKVVSAKLEVDGEIAFEASKALEQKIQADYDRKPNANKMTMDFMKEGDFAQAQVLANVQDFRIRMELSEAAPVTVLVEYLDVLEGL